MQLRTKLYRGTDDKDYSTIVQGGNTNSSTKTRACRVIQETS